MLLAGDCNRSQVQIADHSTAALAAGLYRHGVNWSRSQRGGEHNGYAATPAGRSDQQQPRMRCFRALVNR
ncbi:hypothetical protein B2M20_16385 [Nitrobacter vulgaris]|uniref:Uncharacterized protein n=1 Tax=Nitrobacter vulgaris TaxID=29421 RepID=A0A1V4HV35_NITVU|nr:hypothetical protein B2M20_16385 [Nitrobacter vulgaris]